MPFQTALIQATALSPHVDYDSWLSANTAYCQRHRCSLTIADCDKQKAESAGHFSDLRCQGCGGLDNQPEVTDHIGTFGVVTPRRLQLVKQQSVEIILPVLTEKEELPPETAAQISEQATAETCLDLECLHNLDCCESSFDLAAISALTGDNGELAKELQILFMGEDEEVETKEEIAALYKKTSNRARIIKLFAVYQGRCIRCGGYMDNTREEGTDEKWDDDVYRCLACGWRTSPAYAWNRENPAVAGWRG